ncbi:MAG TPA: hypothetical protein VKB93_06420 [Thermoanaerobaculia bacterium]|nr:hypothetical protein [Thermoanaerobaculia bacterium]
MRLRLVRRFAARRSSRTAWLPISLRWRRKPKKAGVMRASREVTPAAPSVTSMARFHLHFNIFAKERSRSEIRTFAPAKVIRELQRSVMSRHWTTVRAATPATPPRAASSTSRVFVTHRTDVHVSATAAPQNVRLLTTHAKTTHAERRVLFESVRKSATSSFSERLTERRMQSHETRVFRARSVATQRIERLTERQMQSQETRVFRSQSMTTQRIREESTRTHVQLVRPVTLVWRTVPQAQTENARETTFVNPQTVSRKPVAVQEPAPEPVRRAAQRALQASDLDPALLDRLTDDVIRRVERRGRIERERRGL